jgi:hypothetical protein
VPGLIYPTVGWMPSRGYAVVAGGATKLDGADIEFATGSFVLDGAVARPINGAAPTPQLLGKMVYVEALDAMLLVGGQTEVVGALAESWLFDGQGWRQLTPATSPSWRAYHALAGGHDAAPVVLFGGADLGGGRGDTWRFDGDTWTELATVDAPSARLGAAMAYDAASGRYVLFGGYDGSTVLGDTWTFDGAAWDAGDQWREPAAGAARGARARARRRWPAAREPRQPRALPLGRGRLDPARRWRRGPQRRGCRHLFFTPASARRPASAVTSRATARSSAWPRTTSSAARPGRRSARPTSRSPGGGAVGMVARDTARGEVVLAAGASGTLVWDTRAWRQVLGQAPSEDVALAELPDDEVVIGFGDYDAAVTWSWRGGGWTATTLPGPDVYAPAMVYDPGRHAVVLWGGARRGGGGASSDTWLFDGDTWSLLPTAHAPAGRQRAALAYDAARARVVLFGGVTITGDRDAATWALGADDDWVELATPVAPEGRAWAGLGYDAARRSVILFGGNRNGDGPDLVDTWELIGAEWRQVVTATRPARHALTALVPHPLTGALLRVGGSGYLGDADLVDPWQFAYAPLVVALPGAPAGAEACDAINVADADDDGLAGCDDPDCRAPCYPYTDAASAAGSGQRYCGDGTCQLPREGGGICAEDCDACGDGVCAAAFESSVSCPADCDACGDGVCGAHESSATCAGDCP